MFPNYKGGAVSRAGFAFVGRTKQVPVVGGAPPWLIPFQFSLSQGYCLEFGDNYMRVVSNGAYVLEAAKTITGATQANPCVITSNTHGFSNGDWVFISGVGGMTQLNGNTYIVAGVTTNTFQLTDLDHNNVNSTGYGAYTSGGTAARIFTLTTPYAAADMPLVKFTQSADVMSLTHPSYPPQELKRFAANNWTISAANFAALISAPTNVQVTPTVPPSTSTTPHILPTSYGYVITAVDTNTGQESIGSVLASTTVGVDMSVTAGSNIVTWNAVNNAAYYNVYRTLANYNTQPGSSVAAFAPPFGSPTGFVGSTAASSFIDSNITPDLAQVPPLHRNPFAVGPVLVVTITNGGANYAYNDTITITTGTGSGFLGALVVSNSGVVTNVVVLDEGQGYLGTDTIHITTSTGTGATGTITVGPASGTYPGDVAYFQTRRVYAASGNQPDTLWFSHPGDYLNFDTRIPSQADDAITVTPFGQQVNGIQFLVPMPGGLVVLTGLQAWQILGPGSFGATSIQAITPSSIAAVPQAYNGINSQVPPVVINYDILYVQSRGSVVRDLSYNFFANIYTGTDLTVLSSHLFQNFTLTSWAWAEEPYKLLWAVRSVGGNLLSLTYLKEQEIQAWARHDTQGQFQCLCSVSEPPVNALYAVVNRFYQPTNTSIYTVERMDNRLWEGVEDSFCVDAGVATVLPTFNGICFASSVSGNVTFTSQPGVFTAGHVGQVLRMGGGIATISGFTNSSTITGTWVYPCQITVPDLPTATPQGAVPGSWSIAPNLTTVGGLLHLAGQQVVGLADGVPIGPLTVSVTGTVTLPFPASNVKIGLAYTVQLQSIYLDDSSTGPTLQGRRKSIYACTTRVSQSGGFQIGANQVDGSTLNPPIINPVWSGLATVPSQGASYTTPGGATATNLFTGDERRNIQSMWRKPGQIAIQQSLPLPLTVLDIVPEYLAGDLPEAFVTPDKDKAQARQ